MGKEEKKETIELRSEELQALVGRIPSSFERYGIIVMAAIVFTLITGTYFFKYPDSLDAQIVITNLTPALNVVSRTSGNVEYINNKNGDEVVKGELLAVIANTARYEDVIWLKEIVERMETMELNLDDFIKQLEKSQLQLGNMQHNYVVLYKAARNLHDFNTKRYYRRKMDVMSKRLHLKHMMKEKERQQYLLQEENEQIIGEMFRRDSFLYVSKILSEEDYDKAKQNYINSRKGPLNREVEDIRYHIQNSQEQEALLDLANEQFMTSNTYEQAFYSALQEMVMVMREWENTYVMKSSVDGTLNLMGRIGKNSFVSNGETLFVVTPKKQDRAIGKAQLPASGVGKIMQGQTVIVYVNNFPEEEFGTLTGCVSAISNTPTNEGYYIVDIVFPNGLNTIFHKKLPSSQQLLGRSKIIIKDRRLIELFIQPIRILLANNT